MQMLSEFTVDKAYIYSLGILSLGLIISSLEDLCNWRVFKSTGILSWEISRLSRRSSVKGPTAKLLQFFLNDRSFKGCIYLRLITSIFLLILCCLNIISAFVLFLSFFLLLLYMLRNLYGLSGSYQMSLVILFSLSIGSLFGVHSKISFFCIWFISGQLLLSYFIAGIRKGLSPIWRSGNAMQDIFNTYAFGHPFVCKLINNHRISLLLSWVIILFEMLFFSILFINPQFVFLFFILGFLFHLANAFFMGLNGFLFAFSATYPILFYCIQSNQLRNFLKTD